MKKAGTPDVKKAGTLSVKKAGACVKVQEEVHQMAVSRRDLRVSASVTQVTPRWQETLVPLT